jgi:ankyrin repeat protein
VSCQLDRLRRCLSPRIRRALDELPETLDETYERTLLDIDDENWAYAHRLFQCIVVARRPLLVEELAEFLAFKSEEGGSPTFERNWRPENARDTVLSTCSSLVTVINVDGSQVIQFSHFSVKEYLTSKRIADGHRVSRHYIPLEPAHLFVTQSCLSILLELDKNLTKQSIDDYPLARYAGRYWATHAEFENVSSQAEDLIKRLFHPDNHHFANWVWIYDTISDQSMESEDPSRPELSPLHYAALHGFHHVAEWLITTCSQDANESNYESSTPLHIACRVGRFTVAQVLLAHQADVNAGDVDSLTPLHFASWYGHSRVAQLLIDRGADVNAQSWLNETPLCLVSEGGGNMEVAQMLLEHGADLNARSILGWDTLHMALNNGNHPNGHQDLAKLLLRHGADPNSAGAQGQTPLHIAAQRGYLEVTQRLLELDVNVNPLDNRGRTPLELALQNSHEDVAQLLSKHGAKGK